VKSRFIWNHWMGTHKAWCCLDQFFTTLKNDKFESFLILFTKGSHQKLYNFDAWWTT